MTWLIVTIFAYFLLAAVALIDKYLLGGLIPSPKIYAFYVGMFGILVLILVPFGFLVVPEFSLILLALIAGIFRILAIFVFFTALWKFEVSRIVPAIGGLLPLFTFGLGYIFSCGKGSLSPNEIIAFVLLVSGSILITFEKKKTITRKSLQISALAAFLFAFSFVLSKFVYVEHPFLSGFIWIMIGSFLVALLFFGSKEVREEVFNKKKVFKRNTIGIFLSNQIMGGTAFILQNWAIAMVPFGLLAVVFSLEGTKYIFLLVFAILFSSKFPKILK